MFLQTGNTKLELQHIVAEHADDFATVGIPEFQIPNVVMGAGTGRPIYEIQVNWNTQRIAITIGDHGYMVGANPAGGSK